MTVPAPRTPDERQLEVSQKKVAEGLAAREIVKSIAVRMHDDGYSYDEIAERLSRGDRRGGGEGVKASAVQRMIARAR